MKYINDTTLPRLQAPSGKRHPEHTEDFGLLYETYYPLLFRYGIKLIGDPEQVSDTLQELFLYLWERRSLLKTVCNMEGYLFSSYRRLLFKTLTRLKLQGLGAESRQGNFYEYVRTEENVEDQMITREEEHATRSRLSHFLSNLSPRRREVVMLRYYRGYSHEEIAQHMGIKYQTVLNHFQAVFKVNQN